MEVASTPVPKVQPPTISAPPAARNPAGIVKPDRPVAKDEGLVREALDWLPDALGRYGAEALFAVVRGGNNLIWGKDKGGAPVPEKPGSWKFTALGDFGGGGKAQADVAERILAGKPDLLLTTGDNVYYSGTEKEYQKKWDPPHLFGRIRENIPVMPSLGNHDTRKSTAPYFRRFPELDGARYYSYDHKGVHFVALNTNETLAPGSAQLRWLDEDLAKSSADWKVVYFHHPLTSSYPMGEDAANASYLAPILAKNGVDLLLTGHEHNYLRSKPLNNNGLIEVMTGGGGKTLHPFISKKQDSIAYRDVDFGHVEIEVRDNELVGRYVVRNGEVRDTFVIPNNTPGSAAAKS